MIIKCTSTNKRKTKMKVNFGYDFKTTSMPCKMKNPDFKTNSYIFGFGKIGRATIKAKSMRRTKQDIFKCTSLNTCAHKKIIEYRIENKQIIEDVINFRKIANIFMHLYNGKRYGKTIDIKKDSAYVILKFHDKTITSIKQFMDMKVLDVIPDKLFYSLSNI
ncbi:MAG: hypothetical protein ACRC0G_10835 [Fusobacteriaceae bacterium]